MKETVTALILLAMISCKGQHLSDYNAQRISQTASFEVNGRISEVFPLFGPVREAEWAPGWNPEIIYSNSSEVEEHMIFRTLGKNEKEPWFLWTLSKFNPEQYLLEYTVTTSERIWFIHVQCDSQHEKTRATVTYTYTSLTELGAELNRKALREMFSQNLEDWGMAINYYLKTGKQISH